MRNILNTIILLWHSLFGSDILILFTAIITLKYFWTTRTLMKENSKRLAEWKSGQCFDFPLNYVQTERKRYTAFCTFISLFPLLGMLGTVFGLLSLDLAAGDMENIKNNFFVALTSTAWGIIFSCIFKAINISIVDTVEDHIDLLKQEESKTGRKKLEQ